MGDFLLDTNAVIYFLKGDTKIVSLVENERNKFYISFITQIELLCFDNASQEELAKIREFLEEMNLILVDTSIIKRTIQIRKKFGVKIPDAIIAATAVEHNLKLITNDQQLLNKIEAKFVHRLW